MIVVYYFIVKGIIFNYHLKCRIPGILLLTIIYDSVFKIILLEN